jgi:uncharacterized protein (DUF427 family)
VRRDDDAAEHRHVGTLPRLPDSAVTGDVSAPLVNRPDLTARVAPEGDHRSVTTATWNGTVIAESDDIVTVEGNAYFPIESVREDVLRPSDKHSVCPWKGKASYYSLEVDGQVNRDAAWYYPEPKDAAKEITGRVAFYKGVKVS